MEYERLNKENKIKLGKVITTAYFKKDKIWYTVYQKEDREEGNPDYEKVDVKEILYELDLENKTLNDLTDNDFKYITETVKALSPDFNSGGCIDLRIYTNNKTYYIWYFDHRENRVYVDEIEDYLK